MSSSKRARPVTLLLVLLPVWLLGSGGGALWYYFRKEQKDALAEQERFVQAVSVPLIADDLRKIVDVIGERNPSSEVAAANLSRTASMIEGLLGPSNVGYTVRQIRGPADWPILGVTLAGNNPQAPAVWVVASYDSRRGSRGAETNASGLAATLAAAQALARDKPDGPIDFIFLPHSNDADSPVAETEAKLAGLLKLAATPRAVLCVEAMGAGEKLWLTSGETSNRAQKSISGLGANYSEDSINSGGSSHLAARLEKLGLPASRVSTRALVAADAGDDRLPFAPAVAAATGRLVELIRRCATN